MPHIPFVGRQPKKRTNKRRKPSSGGGSSRGAQARNALRAVDAASKRKGSGSSRRRMTRGFR
jgi:hypothetical protein